MDAVKIVYVIVRPCGYIMQINPLIRSEGVREVINNFLKLLQAKGKKGEAKYQLPDYIWTDMSCDIFMFLNNNPDVKIDFGTVKWLVDRFHAKYKHNQKDYREDKKNTKVWWCRRYVDVTRYQDPDFKCVPPYPGVGKGEGDSQAAEQMMNILGDFSWIREMNFIKQVFFIHCITDDLNETIVRNNAHKTHVQFTPGIDCKHF